MSAARGQLLVDLRGFGPELRRPMLFTIVDKLVELNAKEQMLVVTDYDASGMGYQIDLRRETRGKFEFSCDQRSDGAWVAFIRPVRTN